MGRDGEQAPRCDEGQFEHVPGEAAVAVVIFPVDIRRDGTTDADVSGARCHWDEPAHRNQAAHQLVKADTAPYFDRPCALVQRTNVAQSGRVDCESTRALCGIAVTSPQSPGDDSAGPSLEQLADGGYVYRAGDQSGGGSGSAPAGQRLKSTRNGDRHPYRPMPMRVNHSTP